MIIKHIFTPITVMSFLKISQMAILNIVIYYMYVFCTYYKSSTVAHLAVIMSS